MAAATDISAFYSQQTPVPCTAGTLLVLTVDAKGIAMRPEALRSASSSARNATPPGRLNSNPSAAPFAISATD
ncbi:hypothetical protein ABZ297_39425 [Nonomuraea sp. NPDC005983]|uniref:hypothetical protein n=1 Tax=Nonomuraea sp. NPDC005983 TaxID=3155595 RepID=UPI0033B027D9